MICFLLFFSEHSFFLFSFPLLFSFLLSPFARLWNMYGTYRSLRHNILITLVHSFLLAFRPCFCCYWSSCCRPEQLWEWAILASKGKWNQVARFYGIFSWLHAPLPWLCILVIGFDISPCILHFTRWRHPGVRTLPFQIPVMNGGQQEPSTDQYLVGRILGGEWIGSGTWRANDLSMDGSIQLNSCMICDWLADITNGYVTWRVSKEEESI